MSACANLCACVRQACLLAFFQCAFLCARVCAFVSMDLCLFPWGLCSLAVRVSVFAYICECFDVRALVHERTCSCACDIRHLYLIILWLMRE